jgi:hypothetical protein
MPLLAWAQEATIVGTVTDPSGSVIPNVTITLTNTVTGLVTTAATNEAGHYVVPNLRIGKYDLRADATGFKRLEQKDILLQVGDRLRVDLQLQVGAISETLFESELFGHVKGAFTDARSLKKGLFELADGGSVRTFHIIRKDLELRFGIDRCVIRQQQRFVRLLGIGLLCVLPHKDLAVEHSLALPSSIDLYSS